VAMVGRLVQKYERGSYIQKEKHCTEDSKIQKHRIREIEDKNTKKEYKNNIKKHKSSNSQITKKNK
jgi:predicted RNA-binding protein YlxR (DUF448 family)